MAKRKRRGGLWNKFKDAVLGEELPSGEEVRRQYTNIDQIPASRDDIKLDKPICTGSKIYRTIGDLKDAEKKEYLDSYSYGGPMNGE